MEFKIPIRVYMEDTDAGGIVFYVNYLKFLERARTEYMRELGFHKAAFIDESLMFVVTSLTTKYLRPAKLDEQLIVTARVIAAAKASLSFEQVVYRGDEVLCEGQVKLACVDKESLKPKRMPEALLAVLNV
ncbi:tol-pal system-associated acyl-CoA thioesterase [Zhongshania sp.]|jgi:tol-pal system-associated acyl-CoA thioesterase|uniref:tol-pal system-associated acyl-CoA thioesterase n=1 Tax=Zhongshania sp. TaxID=1971902 RepID=UPI001B565E2E|nr:tol-pal system-associated acyl-CoA thioesterase [Zhongshania sp.]MBQ0796069.1 tol-pal system-associated acyl-CoA thioesterase [Zhongshania sp.]|tara:strand:- start:520 stop:912 length:393 start_codon:yes stop_codon:yes gene_type:complete